MHKKIIYSTIEFAMIIGKIANKEKYILDDAI